MENTKARWEDSEFDLRCISRIRSEHREMLQGAKVSKQDEYVFQTHETVVKTFRLPRHINPSEYAAEMIPFIVEDNFTIAGQVDMTFNFSEVRQILLCFKNHNGGHSLKTLKLGVALIKQNIFSKIFFFTFEGWDF